MASYLLSRLCALFCPGKAASRQSGDSAHAFSFRHADDTPLPLSNFKGKVVLIVNTASECGFTPQYAALQELYDRYKDRGLVVLAVPANDFGKQEPGSNEEIQCFIRDRFHTTFPTTAKEVVSGDDAHPFYGWAKTHAGFLGSPKWNFHKYVIDRDGRFAGWYSSPTSPLSDSVTSKIEALLAS